MGVVEGNRAVQVNTQIVSAFDLWFPTDPGQRVLWPSTVRLSEDYFASLSRHAVPLDRRAVAVLASSSMALDVYVWLAQRLHRVDPGKPQFLAWATLHEQFGQGFARVRDFRRRFLQVLRQVHAAYPSARIDSDEKGLTLWHSSPPIPSRGGELCRFAGTRKFGRRGGSMRSIARKGPLQAKRHLPAGVVARRGKTPLQDPSRCDFEGFCRATSSPPFCRVILLSPLCTEMGRPITVK